MTEWSAATAAALESLTQSPLGRRLKREAAIGELTTYRAGGRAAGLLAIESPEDLDQIATIVAATGTEVLVVGRGSNLLVMDAGFDGLVLTLGPAFEDVEINDNVVRAGGAARLPVVARNTVSAGLRGFEWAVGVPGSVGGAVRMNAGGHGADVSDSILSADVVDLTTGAAQRRSVEELGLAYRQSLIRSTEVVVAFDIELEPGDPVKARELFTEIVKWRRENQPGGRNAGSVFSNPDDVSAGELIDTAGGKGLRIGTAEISTKHANFIQSDENGKADDIVALMIAVRDLVLDHHGVELFAETRVVGLGAPDLGRPEIAP